MRCQKFFSSTEGNHSDTISGRRELVPGEIKPISVEQSKTKGGNESEHDPFNAIDRNFSTKSTAKRTDNSSGNGQLWFKATLKKVHCVKWIERYTKNVHQKWNCTESNCSCVSVDCGQENDLTVTVTIEPAETSSARKKRQTSSSPLFPDCKLGNVVKFEKGMKDLMAVLEIVIIVQKPGKYYIRAI